MSVHRGATASIFTLQPISQPLLQNAEAEQALLGSLLARCELADHLPVTFRPEHYADEWHARLHEAVVATRQDGAVGSVAVDVLHRMAIADGEKRGYLATLLGAFIGLLPSMVQNHANTITDMWKRRKLYDMARELTEAAVSDVKNPVDGALQAHLLAAGELSGETTELADADLLAGADEALALSERAREVGGAVGISTGMHSVDDRLGGLEPGTMTVLGGRPGMGKSALGWQWAVHAARGGKKVAGFSLEMTRAQVARRVLSAASGIPSEVIRRGRTSPGQVAQLVGARNELRDLQLRIDETAGLGANMILLRTKGLARRMKGLDLVVIDHLHIIRPDAADVRAGATWAVGRISAAMKLIAKETGAAVLVLAQLSRAVEGREDKRPTMADLRQAGDIEQDADAICFVYRPEYYLGAEPQHGAGETQEKFGKRLDQWHADRVRLRGRAELLCPKVREGEPGNVNLTFDGPTTTFAEAGQ